MLNAIKKNTHLNLKHNMSVNAKLPKNRIGEVTEFIFASLIVAAAFTAGAMIFKAGDQMALMPVTQNQAAVINAY